MNVLFISGWYPTSSKPNFGIFVKEHAKAISSSGVNIISLSLVLHRDTCLWKCSVSDYVDENNVKTICVEINSKLRDFIYHMPRLQYLLLKSVFKKKIASDFSPDIIHSNVILPAGIIGYYFSKYLGVKHVITEHWTKVREFSQMPVLSGMGKKAYEAASIILPVSEYLKNEIVDSFTLSNKSFRVVGNVIDAELFCYKQKQPDAGELRLCSIATWDKLRTPAKQPELLIAAVAKLIEKSERKIKLFMVGGGSKTDELKLLCRDLNVDADFVGYQPKSNIASILQQADFFVHPTRIETFGVVVVEALCTGTPVICSNNSALVELIDKSNGILCENEVDKWVQAIEDALKTQFDHASIAHTVSHRYSAVEIGQQIRSAYTEILK